MSLKNFITVVLIYVAVSFAAWDGTTMSEPSTKLVEGNQYYAIGSPEELAWFASKVNSRDTAISAVLIADIDLNSRAWTPIGKDSVAAFDGVFDGNGHSISGISVSSKMYAGLFGVIDVGTVKNLVIENSKINGYYVKGYYYYSYVGGVAGYANSGSSIQNVTNRASLVAATNKPSSGTSYLYMGGIVGYTRGKIISCLNESDLSQSYSSQYIGGIVGYASNAKLDSLKNKGAITGVDYTGGIAGYAYYGNGTNLNNDAKIVGIYSTGGVLGYGDDFQISNAINNGDVDGKKFVGGICGQCDDESVKLSINKGLVKGIGRSKDSLRVGGICGICSVESSQNQGNIEVEGTYIRNAYVGGISGISSQIRLSLNYGNITATVDSTLYVGGVSGFVNGYYGVSYSGNFGRIKATTTSKIREAHVGGVVGKVGNYGFSNVFNQGKLYSSHYAAGIATVLPQNAITIKNFYVATDTVEGPNAAAFVNYNSTTATLQNGYFDGTLKKNLSLVGENVGVEKDLFIVDTKTLQSDSIAYILDIANFSGSYKSSFYSVDSWSTPTHHWSRDIGYPVFADSAHKPIYQVVFISHKKCSSSSCELDSNKRYTNYRGLINSFPELADGSSWVMGGQAWIKRKNSSISNNFVFSWSDSLVIASYPKCNDFASTDMGCCMTYMLDFQEEYADAYNRYIDKFSQVYEEQYGSNPNYTHFSKDSIAMNYCLDDDKNGLLNWNDPNSTSYSSYNTMKSSIVSYNNAYNQLLSSWNQSSSSNGQIQNIVKSRDQLPNCNSKRVNEIYYVENEDSDYKCVDYKWVNMSELLVLPNIYRVMQPKVFTDGRIIRIEKLNNDERIVVFDAQGRVIKKIIDCSANMDIFVSAAGKYFVMVGKTITAVNIK